MPYVREVQGGWIMYVAYRFERIHVTVCILVFGLV